MKDKYRSIKELLELTLETLNKNKLELGLCWFITQMYFTYKVINAKEHDSLNNYLRRHKPLKATKYWWKRGNKEPRIKWLEEQIKKL